MHWQGTGRGHTTVTRMTGWTGIVHFLWQARPGKRGIAAVRYAKQPFDSLSELERCYFDRVPDR